MSRRRERGWEEIGRLHQGVVDILLELEFEYDKVGLSQGPSLLVDLIWGRLNWSMCRNPACPLPSSRRAAFSLIFVILGLVTTGLAISGQQEHLWPFFFKTGLARLAIW